MLQVITGWIVWLLLLPLRLASRLADVVLGSKENKARDESYTHMDHLVLNAEKPRTSWLNMGDWEQTQHFPTACENLALRLYEASGLQPGASILDVGHGSGDSLALLKRRYRPRRLQGVTSLASHARLARQRLQEDEDIAEVSAEVKIKANDATTEIECDDAVSFVAKLAAHPSTSTFDRIFALDCAYHFHTRQRFLACSRRILASSGSLGLVDLVSAYPYPKSSRDFGDDRCTFSATPTLPTPLNAPSLFTRLRHAMTLRMASVPAANIVDVATYRSHLRQAGFTGDISIVDISHVVFPGFAKFLTGLGKGEESAWRGGGIVQLAALRQFGEVVERWSRGGEDSTIRCVLVIAHASPSSAD